MKRIALLITGTLFLSIALSSCMKSRVCECRSLSNSLVDENFTTAMGSKTKAKAECENHQFDGRVSNPDYTCTLQ
jgi:hypothetical protein